jgi:hypothetical protein
MKRAGLVQAYNGMQLLTCNGQQRLFIVRNFAEWDGLLNGKALRTHYDTTRGGLTVAASEKGQAAPVKQKKF